MEYSSVGKGKEKNETTKYFWEKVVFLVEKFEMVVMVMKSPRCRSTEGDKEFFSIYEVQPVSDTVAYILLFGIALWKDRRNLV